MGDPDRVVVVERVRVSGGGEDVCNGQGGVSFEHGKKRRYEDDGNGEDTDLQRDVKKVLEAGEGEGGMGMSQKICLTMEVLRARQLEIELEKTRRSIQAMVSRGKHPEARTIKAAVASNAVKDLPVGTLVEIRRGMFSLEPAGSDSNAMLMTLVVEDFN